MFGLEVRKRSDILIGDLRRRGHWIVANIEPSMPWPVEPHEIIYDGHQYWIIPVTLDCYPGIAAQADGVGQDELQCKILRLLSMISWVETSGAILEGFTGGTYPLSAGRSERGGYVIREKFDFTYLPVVNDDRAKLALALMREGRGLIHPAYSFLSFYRALEVAVGKGDKRKKWVPDALRRIDDHRAKEAMSEIGADNVASLGLHLYQSGRCAIAHAHGKTIIDPDKPSDSQRLSRELPIIEKLAEMAIEEELAVKTSRTVYREHLYELQGFKKIFGLDLVNRIMRGEHISSEEVPSIPSISVRLRGLAPFEPFECLVLVHLSQESTKLFVMFAREDGLILFKFRLNFPEERLEFDTCDGMYRIPDDGSSLFADVQAAATEFRKSYLLNGCLEIIDSETGEEISRKDAFMPVNAIVEPEVFDREIESWRKISAERKTDECT